MADIRDPRILWTKWGLFILLGSLASAILLLQANSLTATLMLAIAVWSFCRAYYFAFYGIEKYVDANFKYAGIYSLVEYWIAKRPNNLSIHRSDLAAVDSGIIRAQNERFVYFDLAKWFFVAFIANLVVPLLFRVWSGHSFWPLDLLDGYGNDIITLCFMAGLLGFVSVEVALASVFGALLYAPAKYRLPLPVAAIYFLAITILFGMFGADVTRWIKVYPIEVALIISGGVFATVIGIAILQIYRRWSRLVLCCEEPNVNGEQRPKKTHDRQFGIRYLLVATTFIAIGIAIARFCRILSFDFRDPALLVLVFAGLITLLFATVITLLCIEAAFRKTTRQAFRIRLGLLFFSLASFPPVIIALCFLIPGYPGNADIESCAMLYTYFASYCGLLLWICFQFRKRGLRLLTVDNSEKPIMPGSGIKEETEN